MSVHEAITRHSTQQHLHLARFIELDTLREQEIAACVDLCRRGLPFTVEAINTVTAQIHAHAKTGISPLRPFVTEQMVHEYVERL